VYNTLNKRDEELKGILKTLSEHVMDEQTYTEEERYKLMDLVLQLLAICKGRL